MLARGKPARYGIGRERRLRQSETFERLLKEGARKSVAGYTFYFLPRQSGRPRLGILISRKHAAKAVERNRIKRYIREAFRMEQESLGPVDLLVRPPYRAEARADMIDRLRELLSKLKP